MRASNLFKPLLLALLFLLFLKPCADPDFGWHLAQGQWMLANHRVLNQDILTWTFAGRPWSDFYWLAEVGMAFVYQYLGLNALSILFSLLVTSIFWLAVKKLKLDVFSFLAIVIAAALVGAFAGVRPQVLSWGYMILVFAILKQDKPKNYLFLPFIFLLWANTHGSFVAGLGLLGIWSLVKRSKQHILVLFLSLLATLINPYGLNLWRQIFQETTSPLNNDNVIEWQSINFHSSLAWIFLAWAAGYLWLTKTCKERLLLILPWLFLSLYSVRFMPLFILLSPPTKPVSHLDIV